MVCNETCTHDGYSYLFIRRKVTFQEAKDNCERARGFMLENFDRKTVLKLEKCCEFQKTADPAYWVGLQRSNECSNSSNPYRMVHNNACVSELFMTVSRSTGNSNCTGLLLIPAQTSDDYAGLKEQACNQTSSYACQFIVPTTSALPPTTYISTDMPTATYIPTDMPTATYISTDIPTATDINTLIYVGVGLAFLLLALTLLICVICTRKRRKKYLKKRINSEESTATAQINQTEILSEGEYTSIDNLQQVSSPTPYDVYQPSHYVKTSTTHYEQPNVRRPLPRPSSYVYMQLDDPHSPLTMATLVVDTSVAQDYVGDYIAVQRNIQNEEDNESSGYVQPMYPA